jgi:hypothetical protein
VNKISHVHRAGQVHLRSSSQALEGDDRVFRITRQTKLRGPTDCVMFAVS